MKSVFIYSLFFIYASVCPMQLALRTSKACKYCLFNTAVMAHHRTFSTEELNYDRFTWKMRALKQLDILESSTTPLTEEEYPCGGSLLRWAITRGHTKFVQLLITHGFNVNKPDAQGVTPLAQAMYIVNPEIMHLLLNHGADTNTKNHAQDTLLVEMIKRGSSGCAQFLIDAGTHLETNLQEPHKIPLICAVSNTTFPVSITLVKELIKRTPDTAILNEALLYAINRNITSVEIIEELLKAGASVHYANKQGKTVLMQAAELGALSIVELLIKQGVNIHAVDLEGKNALIYAAESCRLLFKAFSIVQILIEAGADPFQKYNNTTCEEIIKKLDFSDGDYWRGREMPFLGAQSDMITFLKIHHKIKDFLK
jgi:ankyrin repeat protein